MKFLNEFWNMTSGGEIRIIHHNHEPQNIIVMDGKTEFDGKDNQELNKMRLLLASIFKTT